MQDCSKQFLFYGSCRRGSRSGAGFNFGFCSFTSCDQICRRDNLPPHDGPMAKNQKEIASVNEWGRKTEGDFPQSHDWEIHKTAVQLGERVSIEQPSHPSTCSSFLGASHADERKPFMHPSKTSTLCSSHLSPASSSCSLSAPELRTSRVFLPSKPFQL